MKKRNDVRQRMTDVTDRMRERRMEGRLDELDRENVRLRTEVAELRGDLDHERSRLREALSGLRDKPTVVTRRRRGGLIRMLVVGGGAYLLGSRAGRERYDQVVAWAERQFRPTTGPSGEAPIDPVILEATPGGRSITS